MPERLRTSLISELEHFATGAREDRCRVVSHGPCSLPIMRAPHHPTIRRHLECWVVDCPECRLTPNGGERFVGIGMRLESQLTAERLRENHSGRPITNAG